MDLSPAIHSLRERLDQVDRVIALLEAYRDSSCSEPIDSSRSRAGRKSMGAEERKMVSERIRQYWQRKRNGLDHKA